MSSGSTTIPRSEGASRGWIFSPIDDLLFLSNIWWVVLGLPWALASDGHSVLSVYQIYFLTTPHRWITLFLVAVDADRREGRRGWFSTLAVIAALIVGGTAWWSDGKAIPCLMLADLIWNAWHFGSQHAGILRIYSGKTGGGRRTLETYAVRILVIYVMLRLVGWTSEWIALLGPWQRVFDWIDVIAILPVGCLVALEITDRPWARLGKVTYLFSVSAIYVSLLAAMRWELRNWLLPLTTCGAAFHAVEYFAIITYYAKRRMTHGSHNVFQRLARQWAITIGAFLLLFGLISIDADQRFREIWGPLNIWAAYLHYAYDGMIWKLRRPATAEALGTQSGARVAST